MNINKIREMLIEKRVFIEGKWELLEFDSAGTVSEVKILDKLLVIHLDNQSKFVGEVNKVRHEENYIDFIKSFSNGNEIIVFRVTLL